MESDSCWWVTMKECMRSSRLSLSSSLDLYFSCVNCDIILHIPTYLLLLQCSACWLVGPIWVSCDLSSCGLAYWYGYGPRYDDHNYLKWIDVFIYIYFYRVLTTYSSTESTSLSYIRVAQSLVENWNEVQVKFLLTRLVDLAWLSFGLTGRTGINSLWVNRNLRLWSYSLVQYSWPKIGKSYICWKAAQ